MQRLGLRRIGRDYTIEPESKTAFLSKAKKTCSELGVKFGAGDTEFIHLSDGHGCCSGSGHFLSQANEFKANFCGALKKNMTGRGIQFGDLFSEWSPQGNVHAYLTTNSRGRDSSGEYSDWLSLLAHRWNGGRSPYSPGFFAGVTWTGCLDQAGFKIYKYENPL